MSKFIFVTGGVMSSLGKGIAASSLGVLLQKRGYKVKVRKLDPYLNVDPGTMSPYQHGEVFVTQDGAETDMDLGHYERFTGVLSSSKDSITAGKIYSSILDKERQGDYLGSTVQVIPHVTDEIKEFIMNVNEEVDFTICEIGGTVGDIEILPFIEAIRQFGNQVGRNHVLYLHLTWLPYLAATKEIKTKPAQHSVKNLLGLGIQPDILLCRCERALDEHTTGKLASFCNMPKERVIPAVDVQNIYQVPSVYHKFGLDIEVCKFFNLPMDKPIDLSDWDNCIHNIQHPEQTITIGIVGKYVGLEDAYKSLKEAIIHAGISLKCNIKIRWIEAEQLETEHSSEILQGLEGILVPGGFGGRGIEGKIRAIEYARTHHIPFFGICLGMQLAVIEFSRHMANLPLANSSEWDPQSEDHVIGMMTEWDKEGARLYMDEKLGGTMRLGSYPCMIAPDTKAYEVYEQLHIEERHRHRYEFNTQYRKILEAAGLIISGESLDHKLVEIIEIKNHPWFIGVQFHPEFLSTPFKPHPLFVKFAEAAIKHSHLV